MGDRLTEEEKQTSPTPYGDIFDKVLPHYMAMGMGYEEFWDCEVGTKTAYREAYAIRIENEQYLGDRMNWYLGQYFASALQAIPLLVAGFNVKKGANLPEYPEKPFYETLKERKDEENRKKQEEDQMMLAMAMFQQFAKNMNKNIEAKPESAGQ